MKNLIKIVLAAALMVLPQQLAVYGQQNTNMGNYTFETECVGVEMDGSLTLIAWGNGRNRRDAVAQAKKVAVRDVLFKGITKGDQSANPRPLVPEVNAERKYEDYFNNFFSDKKGIYKKFVSAKDERIVNRIIRKSMGSSAGVTYKVTVRVLRSELKQKLIQDEILK